MVTTQVAFCLSTAALASSTALPAGSISLLSSAKKTGLSGELRLRSSSDVDVTASSRIGAGTGVATSVFAGAGRGAGAGGAGSSAAGAEAGSTTGAFFPLQAAATNIVAISAKRAAV